MWPRPSLRARTSPNALGCKVAIPICCFSYLCVCVSEAPAGPVFLSPSHTLSLAVNAAWWLAALLGRRGFVSPLGCDNEGRNSTWCPMCLTHFLPRPPLAIGLQLCLLLRTKDLETQREIVAPNHQTSYKGTKKLGLTSFSPSQPHSTESGEDRASSLRAGGIPALPVYHQTHGLAPQWRTLAQLWTQRCH